MKTNALITEAIVIGIMTVVVGTVIGKIFQTEVPSQCKDWNKNHVMEISLFLTGAAIHLLCEYFGVNKWYCKHGSASRT
jgi:small basic protein